MVVVLLVVVVLLLEVMMLLPLLLLLALIVLLLLVLCAGADALDASSAFAKFMLGLTWSLQVVGSILLVLLLVGTCADCCGVPCLCT